MVGIDGVGSTQQQLERVTIMTKWRKHRNDVSLGYGLYKYGRGEESFVFQAKGFDWMGYPIVPAFSERDNMFFVFSQIRFWLSNASHDTDNAHVWKRKACDGLAMLKRYGKPIPIPE